MGSVIEDITEGFKQERNEQKELVAKILADKMEYLEKSLKKESSAEGFGVLLTVFSPAAYCRSCGQALHMFNEEKKCSVCQRSFCINCVKRIVDPNALQAIDATGTENFSCEKDSIALSFQQAADFRRKFRTEREKSEVTRLYKEVMNVKEQIQQQIPQYEYLSTSIVDIKVRTKQVSLSEAAQEKEDDSFRAAYVQVKLKDKKIDVLNTGLSRTTEKFRKIGGK